MKQGFLEILIGFLVLIIASCFFVYAYNRSNISNSSNEYVLHANFENVDGISVGSDVRLSGIKIGHVHDIKLNNMLFYAEIFLKISNDVQLPKDSRAIVSTSGLIGNKYIRINPGASEEDMVDGDRITLTQSALNIEDLIGKLMYSLTSK